MERTSNKLSIILASVIMLSGIALTAIFYRPHKNSQASISVVNGVSYPTFDRNTSSYKIYTQENYLSFDCSGAGEIEGCEAPIVLSSNNTTHQVTIGKKTYSYEITKVPKNSSTISISNIKGIPTTWAKMANLTVLVDNKTDVKYLEYTFDGGKNWQTSNTANITQNGIYKVQARDYFGFLSEQKTIKITEIDSDAPTTEISRENTNDSEAILSAIAADSISGIKSYLWNTGATTPVITTHKSGTYSVTVTDKAGNETKKSIKISLNSEGDEDVQASNKPSEDKKIETDSNNHPQTADQANNPNPSSPISDTKSFTALFVGNGSKTEVSSRTCETNGDSCIIIAPDITRENYEVIGWSTNQNSTSAEIVQGQQISLSGNMTYYAISKRSVSAKFLIQDQKATKDKDRTLECTMFNQQPSCLIATPPIDANEKYASIGWSQEKNSNEAPVEGDTIIELEDDATYYSVTKNNEPIIVSFYVSDENSATIEGGNTKECFLFNGADFCSITAPTLKSKDGYSASGWRSQEDANFATILPGESFEVAKNSPNLYYAVVSNNSINTVTFVIQDTNAITVEGELSYSCTPNERGKCTINTIPSVSVNENYDFVGWSEDPNSDTGQKSFPKGLEIGGNIVLYSITKDFYPIYASFLVQDESAGTISKDNNKKSCYRYNGNSSCLLDPLEFTAKQDYEFVGWSRNKESTTVEKDGKLEIAGDTDFFSVTRSSSAISASFHLLDQSISSMSSGETTCYKYNGADSCEITAPDLAAVSGYHAHGWDTNAETKTAKYKSGEKISIKGGERFYAITQHGLRLTFHIGSNVTTQTCLLYGTETKCSFTFPSLDNIAGGQFVGWSRKQNSTSVDFEPNSTNTISSDSDFYAISRTVVTTVFNVQDPNATTLETTSASCYIYNGENSCQIEVPFLTAKEGYTVLGWNKYSGATTASVSSGAVITVSGSDTYWSITRKTEPLKADFVIPDSVPKAQNGEKVATSSDSSANCYLFNNASKCEIVAPELTASEGYSAIGWSENPSSTSSDVEPGKPVVLDSNKTYYSILSKETKISFDRNINFSNGSTLTDWMNNNIMADSLSYSISSCISYNAQYCRLKIAPRIYSAGNRVLGFSSQQGGNPYLVFSTGFAKSTTLYARVWNFVGNDKNFKLGATHKVVVNRPTEKDYYPIEFEAGISTSVQDEYSDYIEKIFKNVPALAESNGKIRFSNIDTYNSYSDYEGSAGLTYDNLGSYAFIDILSPYNNAVYSDVKHTVVHELGHALDALYFDKTGKYLHDYPEFIESFNSLSETKETGQEESRELNDYALGSPKEFVAEAFVAWYRDNYNGYSKSELGNITPSLNNAFTKYLCYAENSFNMESSNCD